MLDRKEDDWADYGMLGGGLGLALTGGSIMAWLVGGWKAVAILLGILIIGVSLAIGFVILGSLIGRALGRVMDKRAAQKRSDQGGP